MPYTLKQNKTNKQKPPKSPLVTGLEKKHQTRKIQVACLFKKHTGQALFDTDNIPILAKVPVVPRKVKLRTSLWAPYRETKRMGMQETGQEPTE